MKEHKRVVIEKLNDKSVKEDLNSLERKLLNQGKIEAYTDMNVSANDISIKLGLPLAEVENGVRKFFLRRRLEQVSDSYFNFVVGILNYTEKKAERDEAVNRFMDENPNACASDIIGFVMNQPDFHEYGLGRDKYSERK